MLSPLQALIQDQANRFTELSINTLFYHSGLSRSEKRIFKERLLENDWQILILSPEKLLNLFAELGKSKWKMMLDSLELIVLDEAHTYIQWQSYRKSMYSSLKALTVSATPKLITSATLTENERKQLEELLSTQLFSIRYPALAPQIRMFFRACESDGQRLCLLVSLLKEIHSPRACLVFCSSRRETEEIQVFLESMGLNARCYNARRSSSEKSQVLELFTSGRLPIVVATSAFGLGIDYPHVDLVIHLGLPYSVSQYVQEIGRAGRSGNAAQAIALFLFSDLDIHLNKIQRASNEDTALSCYKESLVIWKLATSGVCRRSTIENYFKSKPQVPCGNCDNCLGQTVYQNLSSFFAKRNLNNPWWISSPATLRNFIEHECWESFSKNRLSRKNQKGDINVDKN